MTVEKPLTIDDYKKWLLKNHRIDIDRRSQTYYDSVTQKILIDFQKSEFWKSLNQAYSQVAQKYVLDTGGYNLFVSAEQPELKIKSYDSFLLKTFRKNIIQNNKFPNEPDKGWVYPNKPNEWHLHVNDVIRTRFAVKYLDGVSFLTDEIQKLILQFGGDCSIDLEAKEEGYYAAHIYTLFECEVPREDWATEIIKVKIELQITTQLQEVIQTLLHQYYEINRKRIKAPESKWQWDYKSTEFSTNYLGHILHYVEGMIMDVRDKQGDK